MTDEQFLNFLHERKMKKQCRIFKTTLAKFIIAVMLIGDIFLGIRALSYLKTADEITVQTESSDGQEEAEKLKAEYKEKAYHGLCLMFIFGICTAGIGGALGAWAGN